MEDRDIQFNAADKALYEKLKGIVNEHQASAIGGGIGAALGAAMGGPIGAAIGGGIGGVIGNLLGDDVESR